MSSVKSVFIGRVAATAAIAFELRSAASPVSKNFANSCSTNLGKSGISSGAG